MKATDLLKLINENSKASKSADGEISRQKYANDHTPNNHVKGKETKEVSTFDKGEKHDGDKVGQINGPKSKERRDMEGPKQKAKAMEARADRIKQTIQGIGQDPATGRNSITLYSVKHKGPITVVLADDGEFNALVRDLNSGNDFQATQAYKALINHEMARPGKAERPGYSGAIGEASAQAVRSVIRNIDPTNKTVTVYDVTSKKDVTVPFKTAQEFAQTVQALRQGDDATASAAYKGIVKNARSQQVGSREVPYAAKQRQSTQHSMEPSSSTMRGGVNVSNKAASDIDWDAVGGMSLADSKGAAMESGGSHSDAMGKQKAGKAEYVSKSATPRSSAPNDKQKPTAKVGSPKKKEKRSMEENPAPVKDFKGGENEHKKMGTYEGQQELEKFLGQKLRLTEGSTGPKDLKKKSS